MAKAEWGVKRICPSCGTRYYDMKKSPPVCPSCGTAFDVESVVKARRGRAAPKPVETPAPAVVEIPAVGDEEAEEAVIEDAEELGDDKVEDVVEVEEES
ncbi:MAG TPA: TIGR02300 family protein [Alphaproteobacteria bacterium]|nr:TIGR02300 family protein [Alphaproteobacteria bacterium]